MNRDGDSQDSGPLAFAPITSEAPGVEEGTGTGRRLVIGFVLCCAIAGVCWVVLPRFGVWVPVWLPLGAFVLIVVASIAASPDNPDADDGRPDAGCCKADEGRPICCSGPRPMRMFRK